MAAIETITEASPQERLERTRSALAQQLERRRRKRPALPDAATATKQGMLARVRRASKAWWATHPLHDAVDFATPALQDYAERRPLRILGIAAGAGAAVTLLRPWRMLPVTGVLLALVKASNLKATARSFATTPAAQAGASQRQAGPARAGTATK